MILEYDISYQTPLNLLNNSNYITWQSLKYQPIQKPSKPISVNLSFETYCGSDENVELNRFWSITIEFSLYKVYVLICVSLTQTTY
jgi:hypothetical protein